MTQEEIIKASVAYNERQGKLKVFGGSAILSDEEYYTFNQNLDFIAGAEWMKEQFEKNRLTACDNMTDEEFDREQKFVIDFLKRNNRTPTFSDCIEITRKEIIEKACEFIRTPNIYVVDYNKNGGATTNYEATVEKFKKYMEK